MMQIFYPQNHLLAKHIAYYYYMQASSASFAANYYAFPNTYNGLSIYKSATFNVAPNSLSTYSNNADQRLTLIQSRYQAPLRVSLNGPVDAVTIVFKPLGINYFISSPFAEITRQVSQQFNEWPGPDYCSFMNTFFVQPNLLQRTHLLEAFLLTKLRLFPEDTIMQKAITLLSNPNEDLQAIDLAGKLNLSLRTLNRLFQKNLGLSPVTFRKVLRFRTSLNNKLFNLEFKRLTDIGYANNFYDPSYFNKVYKQFTGSNPSTFFKQINVPGNNAPLFQYLTD